MIKRTSFLTIFNLLVTVFVYGQNIECVGEHNIGSQDSYGRNSTLFNDEMYFVDNSFDLIAYNDFDMSFREVKNSFLPAIFVGSNDEVIFYTASSFGEQVVFITDGSSGAESMVVEFEGTINQRQVIDQGLVVIERNFADNLKHGYFIDNEGSAPTQVMADVENSQQFTISESQNIIIVSPLDEDDFEGVFFFDTNTGLTISNTMAIPDACGEISLARGFDDFIFYRCGAENYIYSHSSQSSSMVEVSLGEVWDTGETEDYIFMAFNFGRLYAIEKTTLEATQIADDMATFPDFTVHGESVYYVNNGNITTHDGLTASVFDIDLGDNDLLIRAETLNDRVHVVVDPTGSANSQLLVLDEINEVAELIIEIDLLPASEIVFHSFADHIIFANDDDEKGQEFFRLSYNADSAEDYLVDLGIKLFPNPVNNLISFEQKYSSNSITSYEIVNAFGQVLKSNIFQENIDVSDFQAGVYYVSLRLKDKTISTIKFIKQ